MKTFYDFYNNKVQLSFSNPQLEEKAKHVWVICRYEDQWLLTKHSDRGLEFPGGKVEVGEKPVEAAVREVKEETGGTVRNIDYLGQYLVKGKKETVTKNIYFAEISSLEKQDTYYETDGPVLMRELPPNVQNNDKYSFIMKDDVLSYSMEKIKELYQIK
ncbi:8-oxo-dGTP diphosphatase [Gracilibacillus halotolerans]|uniref:8-oxo-dGTP diphosphatase n=1 Tax=Gracilibacillus halotolerans TaxID=74386 RepID=A0A841RFL9_9BACI|nr:nucleoside triphosphatase YtkD [Gracilibacillus halotolerans]MBB6511249.1 8-oxo-dGTP diphosphatase [Gracilibacillus halotolerans]